MEKGSKGEYVGEYREGEKEGNGKFTWLDASVYEGQFKQGVFHGFGKLTDKANNYSYEGEFLCGEKHGKGVERCHSEEYDGIC